VSAGAQLVTVPGRDDVSAIDPTSADDWVAALRPFEAWDQLVMLWPAMRPDSLDAGPVERAIATVVGLCTAAARLAPARAITVSFVMSAALDVGGAVIADPRLAGALGACRALSAELPDLRTRIIDIATAASPSAQIASEIFAGTDREVAWRG